MLRISDHGSLNFYPVNEGQDWPNSDYTQKFILADKPICQYAILVENAGRVRLVVRNLDTNEIVETENYVNRVNGYFVYTAHIPLNAEGCYSAEFIDTEDSHIYAGCQFEVFEELPDTMRFRYTNEEHKGTTIFNDYFIFRCEATFTPHGTEFQNEAHTFRSVDYDLVQLSGDAYTTHQLVIGDLVGVPNWVLNKINRIFECTEVTIGELGENIQYVRSEDSNIEKEQLSANSALYRARINLEKSYDGEIAIDISNRDPVVSITFNVAGATPTSTIRNYERGSFVRLPTPQQLGMTLPSNYQFDGWFIDGTRYEEVVLDDDIVLVGQISEIQRNLTYFVAGATPQSITETYPRGTTVILKTPEQLGMVLPAGDWQGWMHLGEIITEVILNDDIVLEGVLVEPRANLLRESRRLLSTDVTLFDASNIWYEDSTHAVWNESGDSTISLLEDISIGDSIVVSFMIKGTNNATITLLPPTGKYIDNVYLNGEAVDFNNPITISENEALLEVAIDREADSRTDALYCTVSADLGGKIEVWFPKAELVAGETNRRATAWVPNDSDAADSTHSYYALSTDSDGRIYPFEADNTPINNFSTNATDTVTINNIVVQRSEVSKINFGESYRSTASLGNWFLYYFLGLTEINLSVFTNVTSIGASSIQYAALTKIDLSWCNANQIRAYFMAYAPLTEIIVGDIDWTSKVLGANLFEGITNVNTSKLYCSSTTIGEAFKARVPGVSEWQIVII